MDGLLLEEQSQGGRRRWHLSVRAPPISIDEIICSELF